MDNFRRFKQPNKHRGSLDGFVGGPRPQQANFQRNHGYAARTTDVGNFRQTDGFHSASQGKIAFPNHATSTIGRQPHRAPDGTIALKQGFTPLPKSKRRKKPHNRTKMALKLATIVLLAGVLTGGYLFGKGYLKARNIFKGGAAGAAALQENVDPTKLNGEGDGRVNILMLGKGGDGHTGADLTDTILVASIDPIQKEAALLSIPRDLYVRMPSNGSMKINAVYATAKGEVLGGRTVDNQEEKAEEAGLDAIEEVVEESMGIPIHYHAMVDFKAFSEAIDAVGGVDVNVKEDLAVYERLWIEGTGRHYILDVKPGQQHFDGQRALYYARSRFTSARGDFDRSQRQREILLALKSKVLSLGTFGNPVKLSQLIDAFGNHAQTNLSINEMMRLYDIGKSIDGSKLASIGLADPPNNYVTTANVGGLSVVVPRAGQGDFSEIQNYIRNAMKDGFLRSESASIMVLNGTNISGLAARKASELKSYGYAITAVADAPTKTYDKTIIVDLRNGDKKYTKAYLEKRLGASTVTSLPDGAIAPGTADFVIILGQNESTTR